MKKYLIVLLLVATSFTCLITTASAAQNWITMSETTTIIYQIDKGTMNFLGPETDKQVDVWMRMVLKDKDGMSIVGHYLVKEKDLSFTLKERITYSASGATLGSVDASAKGWVTNSEKSPIGSIAKRLFIEYREKQKLSATSFDSSVKDMHLYENKPNNFKVKYPSRWMVTEGVSGSVVGFISPMTEDDERPGIVVVHVKEIPRTIIFSLEQFEEINLAHAEKKWEDYKLIKRGNFGITGVPAKIHIFTAKKEARQMKMVEVYTIANNKAYIFLFAVDEINYDKYAEAIMEMMNSITISLDTYV